MPLYRLADNGENAGTEFPGIMLAVAVSQMKVGPKERSSSPGTTNFGTSDGRRRGKRS